MSDSELQLHLSLKEREEISNDDTTIFRDILVTIALAANQAYIAHRQDLDGYYRIPDQRLQHRLLTLRNFIHEVNTDLEGLGLSFKAIRHTKSELSTIVHQTKTQNARKLRDFISLYGPNNLPDLYDLTNLKVIGRFGIQKEKYLRIISCTKAYNKLGKISRYMEEYLSNKENAMSAKVLELNFGLYASDLRRWENAKGSIGREVNRYDESRHSYKDQYDRKSGYSTFHGYNSEYRGRAPRNNHHERYEGKRGYNTTRSHHSQRDPTPEAKERKSRSKTKEASPQRRVRSRSNSSNSSDSNSESGIITEEIEMKPTPVVLEVRSAEVKEPAQQPTEKEDQQVSEADPDSEPMPKRAKIEDCLDSVNQNLINTMEISTQVSSNLQDMIKTTQSHHELQDLNMRSMKIAIFKLLKRQTILMSELKRIHPNNPDQDDTAFKEFTKILNENEGSIELYAASCNLQPTSQAPPASKQ